MNRFRTRSQIDLQQSLFEESRNLEIDLHLSLLVFLIAVFGGNGISVSTERFGLVLAQKKAAPNALRLSK